MIIICLSSVIITCFKIELNNTLMLAGGRDYPIGGLEYNLKNDVEAANVVFSSNVKLYQVPRNVYRMMPVSHAELLAKVYPYGKIGEYLARNIIEFNNCDKKNLPNIEY